MARDAKSVTDYWKKLAEQHGVSEETANAILTVIQDEKAGKAFLDGFVPQSDYSRDLNKQQEEWKGKLSAAEQTAKEVRDWYSTAKPAYDAALEEGTKLKGRLAKYEETFGSISDDGGAPKLPPDVVTRKDLEELAKNQAGNTARVMKDLVRAATDHVHRFGEPLDVDAFEKYIVDNNLSPREGYDRYISPKLEERRNNEIEARVKREREEAVRDYASRHKMPVDQAPRELSPFFDRKEPAKDSSPLQQDRDSRNVFIESMRNPAGQTTN